jgi:hypothetical protein
MKGLEAGGRPSKTICFPSGDQRGVPMNTPSKKVNPRTLRPSAPATQISGAPERADEKAIHFPSDENWGVLSQDVEAISCVFSPATMRSPGR